MLKLNAAYSKKVPAEGEYTSQSYHASIEVELPDGLSQEQLNDKILPGRQTRGCISGFVVICRNFSRQMRFFP